jgi:hypothetical protein
MRKSEKNETILMGESEGKKNEMVNENENEI